MKRTFVIIVILAIALVAVKSEVIRVAKNSFSSDQKPYQVKRQEFFDKLSLRYYGTEKYGEALNLVNNHYQINDFSTDEANVMIPSLEAIQRLHQGQTLLVIDRMPEDVTANSLGERTGDDNEESKVTSIDVIKGSTVYFLLMIFFISGLLSLYSFYRLQKRIKHRKSGWFPDEDDEPVITDDSILLDFDLSKIESKSYERN